MSRPEHTSFYWRCLCSAEPRQFDPIAFMESLGIDSEIPYDSTARDFSRESVTPTATKFLG